MPVRELLQPCKPWVLCFVRNVWQLPNEAGTGRMQCSVLAKVTALPSNRDSAVYTAPNEHVQMGSCIVLRALMNSIVWQVKWMLFSVVELLHAQPASLPAAESLSRY